MQLKDRVPYRPLQGRRILVGVCGGIAAYKVAGWVRSIRAMGAEVRVVMTGNGARFVSPLTFSTLSGHQVVVSEFDPPGDPEIPHIALARWADALLVAPATANTMAKAALGLADDLLLTTILAAQCPVLFAPAMNPAMLANPATQENLSRLRRLGHRVIEPETGAMACGMEGKGRLASWGAVRTALLTALQPPTLTGRRVLITAGPTREPLDPVRYLSNRSSGKMGYAMAEAAVIRGAESVTLIHGPVALEPVPGARMVPVETAADMMDAVQQEWAAHHIAVMAAAVADYRPAQAAREKIKKSHAALELGLEPTEDCLLWLVSHRREGQLVVGFCAETGDLAAKAQEKLRRKGPDIMVANDVAQPGAGFDHDTNRVLVLAQGGGVEELPMMSKWALAHEIWKRIEQRLQERSDH